MYCGLVSQADTQLEANNQQTSRNKKRVVNRDFSTHKGDITHWLSTIDRAGFFGSTRSLIAAPRGNRFITFSVCASCEEKLNSSHFRYSPEYCVPSIS